MEIRQQILALTLICFVILFVLPVSVHSRPELPLFGKNKPDCVSGGRTYCTEVTDYPADKIQQSLLNIPDYLLGFLENDIETTKTKRSVDYIQKLDTTNHSTNRVDEMGLKRGVKLLDVLMNHAS